MKVKVYVEGGGNRILDINCREGFRKFIEKSGISPMPQVVAGGSAQDAYTKYCNAIDHGEEAFLLVDAEESINGNFQHGDPKGWKPWAHLKARAEHKLEQPTNGQDTECHLMVQVMESWFIADPSALEQFFGDGFKKNKLPLATPSVEATCKEKIYTDLKRATTRCESKGKYNKGKGKYNKGKRSFEILSEIDPNKVVDASPWAKRFIDELKNKMAQRPVHDSRGG